MPSDTPPTASVAAAVADRLSEALLAGDLDDAHVAHERVGRYLEETPDVE